MPTSTAAFAADDLNDMQVRELVSRALDASMGDTCSCYVQDMNRIKGFVTYSIYGGLDRSSRGALYRVTFTVADDYSVTFGEPEKVVAVTEYETAADFSLETDADDEPRARFSVETSGRRIEGDFAVYPNSLLFRAGEYPDKKFSMSPQELQRAAEGWKEVAGNVQHTDFLKGRAAFISRAWTENDGEVLRGEVRVPLALDELLTDGEKRLSMEWNRAGKWAEGFALCTNPRVSDAALMSVGDKIPSIPADQGGQEKPRMSNPFAEFLRQVGDLCAKFTGGASAEAENQPDADKALRRREIEADAALFAAEEIAAQRLLPAEKANLIAEFVQAALDDAASPVTVSFSAGTETKQGGRLDALKARQSGRLAHNLTREVIADAPEDAQVLFAGSGQAKPNKLKSPTEYYAQRAKQTRAAGAAGHEE